MTILADYLPEDKFAEEMGVSRRTAQRWRQERVGPAWTEIGKQILYRRDSVAAWLKSREHKLPSERRGRR